MSLLRASFSFLAIKPKVLLAGDWLITRSSFIMRLLSLFSCFKCVIVDKRKKNISISEKYFWVFSKSRCIPFEQIKRINYSFSSVPTSWNLFVGTTDRMEWFTVSLILCDTYEEVRLWTFFGEGAVATGWKGILLGEDEILDLSGDQKASSLNYIKLLQSFTGKMLT